MLRAVKTRGVGSPATSNGKGIAVAETTNVLDIKPSPEKVGTGIRQSERRDIAQDLSQILADSYLLVIKSHVYHWNVVGPLFRSIHEMTEQHYEEIFAACDELAERIRALGFPAPMSKNGVLADGTVTLGPLAPSAHEMVQDLVQDHEALCRKMRKVAENADEVGDLVTADLLTQRLAYHEKVAWMLRAVIAE